MKTTIILKRFTAGSLFKIIGLGYAISLVLFSVVMGGLALFGANTVNWNGHHLTGVSGLVAAPFIGAFLAVVFTLFTWVAFAFSYWLVARFGSVKLEYIGEEASRLPPTLPPRA